MLSENTKLFPDSQKTNKAPKTKMFGRLKMKMLSGLFFAVVVFLIFNLPLIVTIWRVSFCFMSRNICKINSYVMEKEFYIRKM